MKMKHYVSAAVLALAFAACSDDYDDSALWDAVNGNTQRIEALEAWQDEVNGNIAALQQLLNTTDYITSVTPLTENGEEVGYVIEFHNSDPITIRHGAKGDKGDKGDQGEQGEQGPQGEPGKDGEDGADGSDGEDGSTPVIGLTQGEDGNWYWTLNGELMRDPNGDPIRANGEKGEQGNKGESGEDGDDGTQGIPGTPAPTPQIKLGSTLTSGTYYGIDGNKQADADDTAWYLSVDDGATWYRISGNKGDKGDTGATGPQGPQGDKGDTGEQGDKGEQGEQGEQGDSWFAKAPELSDDGTHYIFTLTEKDKDGNNLTIEVPAYQGTLKIGDGTGTLILENVETTIDITLPTGTKAADYTALVAQITPEGADGTYTDIDSRAGDAVGGWSVTATLAESSSVTIKTTQAGTALLRVTLIRTDGSELTASCIVNALGYTYDESTNTYTVYTAEGLQAWVEAAPKYYFSFTANCVLGKDITLTENWKPISQYESSSYPGYNGTFDGQGYTISNVTVTADDTGKAQGFIGYLGEKGVVKNLNLVINSIQGYEYAGGIVGYSKGTIVNCHVTQSEKGISGTKEPYSLVNMGGIAGANNGTIIACTAACTLVDETGNIPWSVGGIAGYNFGGQIIASHEACTITAEKESAYLGGITGYNTSSAQVTACYSVGNGTGAGVAGYCENSKKDMRFAACYWDSEAANAFGYNIYSAADEATKVEGDVTWTDATTAMNAAIKTWNESNNNACPYHYEQQGGTDNPPVLVGGAPR